VSTKQDLVVGLGINACSIAVVTK